MTAPVLAAVALGSNVGDRGAHLSRAVAAMSALPGTRVLRVSPMVETAPVRVGECDPGGAFLNGAAVIETGFIPAELLRELHRIEAEAGRDRSLPRGSPRPLDLDLLLYGDRVIQEGAVVIPHPRLHERRFVLGPLAAIAPDLVVPSSGRTVAQLLAALDAAPNSEPAR